jgi:NAD(P)-dependent dehydrogenase (short-subunit alcohol dehydrogenase family)
MNVPKNIVITGSSRGIGFALANEFLKAGCQVMISGKSREHLKKALASFKEYKGRVFTQPCDVTRLTDLNGLWKAAQKRLGTVDVWINNAGIGQDWLPIWDVDPAKARAIVETNVIGLIHGAQIAFKGMRAQEQGQIWNMEGFGSDGRHMDNLSVYGTTKRALRYFTEALALEARGSGVLIGSMSPGMMATDFVLEPMRHDPERLKQSLKIFNIIGDKPETVARFMVPRILANKRQGRRLAWLTGGKIMLRFLTAPFVKRKVFEV